MAGFVQFLRCVGRAVVKNGARALANLVPMGEVLFDVARDAREEYCQDRTEPELRADLESLARASRSEVRQAAEQVAALEAAGESAEISLALVSYLDQLPASIRQSLRRPSDPNGITVPVGRSLRRTDDLLPFLPAGLPRFKAGDRPLAADWELVELLGKGGFGEVWKARHLTRSSQKPVALKFCLNPVAAQSIRHEAALHNQLDRVRQQGSTLGVVPLLETYLRADPPCLMYEYIEGGDLTGLIQELHEQNRLTPEFAARIVQRLAVILTGVHRLSPPLVHRDLKPSNILVRQGEGDLPELFVADFGIGGLAAGQALHEQASQSTPSQSLPTAVRGAYTPLYASPQQVRGDGPDPRDDVHALGVIWYQLLTGDLSLVSIPPDWQEVVQERGLGQQFIQALASCLASRAEKRLPDAGVLADRLAIVLDSIATGDRQTREQAKPEPFPRAAIATLPAVTIESPRRTYTLRGLLAVGDVADVHLATSRSESTDEAETHYVLKVSRIRAGHSLLANERNTLVPLLTAAGDTTYRKYLPTLAESFSAKDRFQKRVNVFLYEPGFYTLEQVHDRHPALDGRHLAWIFKRLLTVVGFSHTQRIVHGAVLPCHVLIHAANHGLQLVGWGQSVETSRTINTIATRYKEWYPPEVLKKEPASGATDLFLAARCLIYLAGGDPVRDRMPDTVPVPMQRFVKTLLLEGAKMRPNDAWQLLEEFDELLCQLYGPPKFHPLIMT